MYLAVRHFQHLLEGRQFTIYTDHKPLTFAFRSGSNKYSPRESIRLHQTVLNRSQARKRRPECCGRCIVTHGRQRCHNSRFTRNRLTPSCRNHTPYRQAIFRDHWGSSAIQSRQHLGRRLNRSPQAVCRRKPASQGVSKPALPLIPWSSRDVKTSSATFRVA